MATKRKYHKTKKLSGVPKNFRKWGEWDIGDVVIGKYIGTHTDQYKKVCMIIEVEDAQFKDKKLAKSLIGKNLVLNSAGQIDKAREESEEGQMLQVMYNGTSIIEKGPYKGKDSHLIEVDLLETDTPDEEESEDSEDEETEYEDEEEESEDDEDLDL